MKILTIRWFPRRCPAAVLLLAASVSSLFAQPVITTQPANLSVPAGQTASFSAVANGGTPPPLMVRWEEKISGGTFNVVVGPVPYNLSSMYSFNAQAGQNGNQYRAVFTDAASIPNVVATAPATLTVYLALATGQIDGNITLDPGTMMPDFAAFFTFTEGLDPNALSVGGISGLSPVQGDPAYPDVCPSGALLIYPYNNSPKPAQSTGKVTPTPLPGSPAVQDYFKADFIMSPSTDQIRDPVTEVISYPNQRDYLCIPYWVNLQLNLGPNGRKTRYFPVSYRSDALLPDDPLNIPFADTRSFTEPVGAIHLRFKCDDHQGSGPQTLKVVKATITATIADTSVNPPDCSPPYRDPAGTPTLRPGKNGTVQAIVDFTPTTPSDLDVTFLVRSGHRYDVSVQFIVQVQSGAMLSATYDLNTDIDIPCGAFGGGVLGGVVQQGHVVEICREVNKFFCDGGGGCISAEGRLEMKGTSGVFGPGPGNCLPPVMGVQDGPLNFAVAAQVIPDSTVLGAAHYTLLDVPPSCSPDWPYKDYEPGAVFYFETGNGFLEFMHLIAQRRPFKCSGPVENLDPMFVMEHGLLMGDIHLEGPLCATPQSCLQLITAPPVSRCAGNFWAAVQFAPFVQAEGPGLARSAIKGSAMSATLWQGSYEMYLTKPNDPPAPPTSPCYTVLPQQPPATFSHWIQDLLSLRLDGPDPAHPGILQIVDVYADGIGGPGAFQVNSSSTAWATSSGFDIQHGQTGPPLINHHDYCLSEITLYLVRRDASEMIRNPSVNCRGSYGLKTALGAVPKPDYKNSPAGYWDDATMYGTPLGPLYTATDASIRLCLLQGDDYTITPKVEFPNGTAQFPGLSDLKVGCGVCYEIHISHDGVGPMFDVNSGCASLASYTLQGIVQADVINGHLITEVSYSLNNIPIVPPLYMGSGVPSFDLSTSLMSLITLQPCVNTIEVSATDNFGISDKATFTITLDSTPPVLGGCTNIFTNSLAGTNGNFVSYPLPTALDNCDGPVPVNCALPSGSFFPIGQTVVTCTAKDKCGNTSTCQFNVTVTNPCPELVINGSFETTSPVVVINSFNNTLNPVTGLPSWTTASQFLEVWRDPFGDIPASEGTHHLEINAQSDNETVSQVLTGLRTNCPVTFCFDYTGRFDQVEGGYNNDFTVTLSGGASLSVPLNPAIYSVGGWQTFCTNFVPASSTLTIAFHGQPHFTDGTAETQGGAHIDNVSLTQCCCPPNRTLRIVYSSGNIIISWSGANYRLQTTTSLTPIVVWTDLPGTSPITIPVSETARFFRLVCP